MKTTQPVLLVIPPFTQSNTPYPSTAYLKGFLNTKNIPSFQVDLSLEVILEIFSSKGLERLFSEAALLSSRLSSASRLIFSQQDHYLRTIDSVIPFLQGKNETLGYLIANGDYLPDSKRLKNETSEDSLEWAFGTLGIRDKARFLASLYMDDLSDFIKETVDSDFGFSRYAEHLGRCASSFDQIQNALKQPLRFTDHFLLPLLESKIRQTNPKVLALSVPFPGNLYSALRCAEWVKKNHPHIQVIMGGGFVNTELRSINDCRFFKYIDYLLLDDGEITLYQLLQYLEGNASIKDLVRTFYLEKESNQVRYQNNTSFSDYQQEELGAPDYSNFKLNQYLSIIEVMNPMHKLWSDGRWNKLTLAHGCYWGKCTFCDGTLDYIQRYAPNKATTIVDRIEKIIRQTGEIGFHFIDEAAPPSLLKEVALEIIRRKLTIVWWGNIRFEKNFTTELCNLLKRSGCIAISGGLEVASPRLLQLINKGVTVAQVARVANNFTMAGIMVHAYLMYGFPSQTTQETIDSLETVRQMFELGLIQSGFWHRFAMTAHSPVGLHPSEYSCRVTEPSFCGFAKNDIQFEDTTGCQHELFGEGLRISLYNYMNGVGFELPLYNWFKGMKIPHTTLPPNYIKKIIQK